MRQIRIMNTFMKNVVRKMEEATTFEVAKHAFLQAKDVGVPEEDPTFSRKPPKRAPKRPRSRSKPTALPAPHQVLDEFRLLFQARQEA